MGPPINLEGAAFSYIRFSAKEQERGDSLRRQSALRDAWLARHPGVTLDTSLTLHDLGVSAFKGLHRDDDRYALGEFLRLVKSGRIARGSLLLLENLDRLSREEEEDAVALFLDLLRAGITIVQLEPENVFRKGDGMFGLLRAVMELSRGHQESQRKSVRVSAAWSEKKREAAASGRPVTARCPAWLELVDGQFYIRPGADTVIRRMFDMCKAGYGCRAIAAALMKDGVPAWGKGKWEEAYVRKVLAGRAVLGEYTPMKGRGGRGGKRTADAGVAPVANYYPAIVTEADWLAANAARKSRDRRGGRPTKHGEMVHVFQGLLKDARTGGSIQVTGRMEKGIQRRVLINAGYKRHGDPCIAFPLDTFEAAVLSALREVDPRAILPGEGGGDRVLEFAGRLAAVEGRLAALTAELVGGDQDVPTVLVAVRDLEAKRKAAAEELAAARAEAASPLSESWGEFGGLAKALASAPDPREARVRLRSILRRLTDSIWVLVVPCGMYRLAAVQVWFAGGGQRSYLILHQPARAGKRGEPVRPSGWRFLSFAAADGLDLRKPDHARRVERSLSKFDPAALGA